MSDIEVSDVSFIATIAIGHAWTQPLQRVVTSHVWAQPLQRVVTSHV